MGNFFGFFGVLKQVKININSSSQYIRLQYKGWEGGTVSVDTKGEGVGIPLPWWGPFSKCWYKTQVFRALKMLKFT